MFECAGFFFTPSTEGYLPWIGGGGGRTYLGWGGIYLGWGYLPWTGIVPTLNGGYLPWPGSTYLGQGVPTWDRGTYPGLGGGGTYLGQLMPRAVCLLFSNENNDHKPLSCSTELF